MVTRRTFLKLVGGVATTGVLSKLGVNAYYDQIRTFSHGGISIAARRWVSDQELLDVAKEINLVNPLVSDDFKIRKVDLTDKNDKTMHIVFSNIMFKEVPIGVRLPKIRGGQAVFSTPNAHRISSFHEAAHALFADDRLYKKNEQFGQAFSNVFKHYKIPETSEITKYNAALENNPFFRIFDESHYQNFGFPIGHPSHYPQELFASASAVMRHFPKHFLDNLELLGREDPKAHEIALDVTRKTLGFYGEAKMKVFSPKLISAIEH
ncbi:MAG: hypothetical protein ABIG96_02920 [Candidatus Micrarchaeota archaeon]